MAKIICIWKIKFTCFTHFKLIILQCQSYNCYSVGWSLFGKIKTPNPYLSKNPWCDNITFLFGTFLRFTDTKPLKKWCIDVTTKRKTRRDNNLFQWYESEGHSGNYVFLSKLCNTAMMLHGKHIINTRVEKILNTLKWREK